MSAESVRRLLARGVAAAALLTLLTACGGGTDAPGAPRRHADAIGGRYLTADEVRPDGHVRARPAAVKSLSAPRLALAALPAAQRQQAAARAGQARQVAVGREMAWTRNASTTARNLRWQALPGGGQAAQLDLHSPGAAGLRAALVVDALPPLALVSVFAPGDASERVFSGREIVALLQSLRAAGADADSARTWWSPLVDGDTLSLRIELPPGVAADEVRLALPLLSHFVESPAAAAGSMRLSPGASGSCQINAACHPDYAKQRSATAHIVYQRGGAGYVCTGTLLNDEAGSGTPYFLTAHHCISTSAEAASIETHWFAEASACDESGIAPQYARRSGGAQILYLNDKTDTSFLRLNQTLPPGVYFAGWSAETVAGGQSVAGIHHPSGDLRKISFGGVAGFQSCTTGGGSYSCTDAEGTNGRFIKVIWSQGVTEGGSSGSAIFTPMPGVAGGEPVVVGQLYGGLSSCTLPDGPDQYGRFDIAYHDGIKAWLSGTTAATPAAPQSGWWWNAAESGRGFALELRGQAIFLVGFMYEETGPAVWYSAALTRQPQGHYHGSLLRHQGGQSFGGAYRPPSVVTDQGWSWLQCSTSTDCQLNVMPPGSQTVTSIPLTRYPISSPPFRTSKADFESGWWWNPAESGRGFFIEMQDDVGYAGVFGYLESGQPQWYTSSARLLGSPRHLLGPLFQYSHGQSLFGPHQLPVSGGSTGLLQFQSSTPNTGTITLPGGVSIPVQRFVF